MNCFKNGFKQIFESIQQRRNELVNGIPYRRNRVPDRIHYRCDCCADSIPYSCNGIVDCCNDARYKIGNCCPDANEEILDCCPGIYKEIPDRCKDTRNKGNNAVPDTDKEISEIESICDSCYNMSRVINRKYRSRESFTEEQTAHIKHMWELCDNALSQMELVLADTNHSIDPKHSLNIENEINNYRTQLKENNVTDVNDKKYDYQTGVNYMDIIGDSEKLGDYAINVVEAHTQVKLTT